MRISILFFVLFTALSLPFGMNAQQSIKGIWNTGNQNTKIKIKEVNGKMIGVLSSSDNKKAKIGAKIIKDIQSKKGVWKGKLFAAKKRKWVDAVFKRKGNKLKITVSAGLISKTIEWKRN